MRAAPPPDKTNALLSRIATVMMVVCSAAMGMAQSSSSAQEAARPGALVDIGGRRLHLHCIGNGQPTVVFESSSFQFALDWSLVQPDVANTTRACSYDRAGLGWSEPGPHFEHPDQIVSDLHALLTAAGEKPPYVLVSMSMGAFYTRAYQTRYSNEVAGLVFLEPVHEDVLLLPIDRKPTPLWSLSAEQAAAFVKSLNASPRPPAPPLSTGAPFDKLPAAALQTRLAFERRAFEVGSAESVDDQIAGFQSRRETAARLHMAGAALGVLPVIVLTAAPGGTSPSTAVHAKTAVLSKNSTQRVILAAHMIHLDAPVSVVNAVIDVVTAIRTNTTITP